jgi:hypothetical protein
MTLDSYRRGCGAKIAGGRVFEGVSRVGGCAVIAQRRSNIIHYHRSRPAKCNPFARRYFDAAAPVRPSQPVRQSLFVQYRMAALGVGA